jgi:hypothetical protein
VKVTVPPPASAASRWASSQTLTTPLACAGDAGRARASKTRTATMSLVRMSCTPFPRTDQDSPGPSKMPGYSQYTPLWPAWRDEYCFVARARASLPARELSRLAGVTTGQSSTWPAHPSLPTSSPISPAKPRARSRLVPGPTTKYHNRIGVGVGAGRSCPVRSRRYRFTITSRAARVRPWHYRIVGGAGQAGQWAW